MTQLVPIALDLVLSPEDVAKETLVWMAEQDVFPRDATEREMCRVAAIRAAQVVQDRAREIGRDLDRAAAQSDGTPGASEEK